MWLYLQQGLPLYYTFAALVPSSVCVVTEQVARMVERARSACVCDFPAERAKPLVIAPVYPFKLGIKRYTYKFCTALHPFLSNDRENNE